MGEKYQYFNSLKFTRDERTGYYLCATPNKEGKRQRMHVYVWEFYNGKVIEGYHVHHIDENKSNNEISNLELLTEFEHLSLHGRENSEKNYQMVINNLKVNAIPKASVWHGSENGREWHKMHYEKMKSKLHIKLDFICQNCGKAFTSTQVNSKFCSNNCKSAWRRKSGADDISKICEDCGIRYVANKYQKTKYCQLCQNKKH